MLKWIKEYFGLKAELELCKAGHKAAVAVFDATLLKLQAKVDELEELADDLESDNKRLITEANKQRGIAGHLAEKLRSTYAELERLRIKERQAQAALDKRAVDEAIMNHDWEKWQ